MKLLSLNVGTPQLHLYHGKEVRTAIFKYPVEGKRQVTRLNIEGDIQGDLSVHGGEMKAVYGYDVSYYDHWKKILQRSDWGYGLFGENLTTSGLSDDTVQVGNIYRIGSTYLEAVQPRFPCYKLNIRFGREDMVQQFAAQQKHGIYFRVVQEGSIEAGDDIVLAEPSKHKVTIQDFVNCYYSKGADRSILEQLLALDFLPGSKRKAFESFIH